VSIAYQVVGNGPFDVVFVPPSVSNVELGWEVPTTRMFLERIASFSRLIHFDKRGTGMSDRVTGAPSLETRMDDVRAVMDSVGSERAALVGWSEGVAMAALRGQLPRPDVVTCPLRGQAGVACPGLPLGTDGGGGASRDRRGARL
jgi:pimeloyl-ACP methyl ester carboxylesterase